MTHEHEWEHGAHMAEAFGIDGRRSACAICGALTPPVRAADLRGLLHRSTAASQPPSGELAGYTERPDRTPEEAAFLRGWDGGYRLAVSRASQPPSGDAPDLREALIPIAARIVRLTDVCDDEDHATIPPHVHDDIFHGIGQQLARLINVRSQPLAASAPSSPATPAPLDVQPPSGDARETSGEILDRLYPEVARERRDTAPSGDALLSAAMLVNGGWHSVVEGDNVRMRYASDLPARLNTLREALAQPPSGDAPDLREALERLLGDFDRTDPVAPKPRTIVYDEVADEYGVSVTAIRDLLDDDALAASPPSSPATPAPLEVDSLEREAGRLLVESARLRAARGGPDDAHELRHLWAAINAGNSDPCGQNGESCHLDLESIRAWTAQYPLVARAYANQEGGEPREEDQ